MNSQHKRPKYSLEFKQDAAKLVLEKGYNHQQAADSLGISFWTHQGWLYLAVVLDLYSRQLIGWAMAGAYEDIIVLASVTRGLLT